MFPILEPLPPLLPVVGDLKTDAVGVRKEDRIVVAGVLRVKPGRGTSHSFLRKPSGDRIHGGGIFDAKAEVVQTRTQRIVSGRRAPRGPQDEAEVAIVVLNVAVSVI